MTSHATTLQSLLRKLELLAALDDADREWIASLPLQMESVPARHLLIEEGRAAANCCLLAEGYACRHKTTSEGARQIVSFHMRGDILDLQHLLFPVADHNVETVTPAIVAWIPAEALKRLIQQRPTIRDALWRDTLIDASIFREWVLNVGRRNAKARVAHMLCEFAARGQAVGIGSAEGFELPMTQEEIGDATGLTSNHVNRTLRALREEGVIVQQGRQLIVRNWPHLREIAGFDSDYLHNMAREAA